MKSVLKFLVVGLLATGCMCGGLNSGVSAMKMPPNKYFRRSYIDILPHKIVCGVIELMCDNGFQALPEINRSYKRHVKKFKEYLKKNVGIADLYISNYMYQNLDDKEVYAFLHKYKCVLPVDFMSCVPVKEKTEKKRKERYEQIERENQSLLDTSYKDHPYYRHLSITKAVNLQKLIKRVNPELTDVHLYKKEYAIQFIINNIDTFHPLLSEELMIRQATLPQNDLEPSQIMQNLSTLS